MGERFDFEATYGAEYDRFIRRVVPGYEQIFPAALALLRPHVPAEGRVLVVGAGSGSELATFAEAEPGWRLTGVDPAAQMIGITRERLERLGAADRVTLHHGLLETLPAGEPFDAATLDLVLHFVPDAFGPKGKLGLLRQIAERLRPGGALVLVDGHGDPKSPSGRIQLQAWMGYLAATGMSAEAIATYRAQLDASVHWIDERRLMALLETAGFVNPVPFYRYFVFGGWVVRRR